jgi:dUTP pyrophosphatase
MYVLYLYTEDPVLKELYLSRSIHAGDSGVDLYVPKSVLGSTDTVVINYQIRCRMALLHPDGRETPVSYYLYPRSSLSKTRLRLANSVGIIDAGYRGEIMASFDIKGATELDVDARLRLVQLCSPTLDPIRLVVVDTLDLDTERGAGGFGSTGR